MTQQNAKNKEIFSKNLAYYMNKKGVDRNTLCADLDLKYTTVRDWLKGITYPRIGKIELLANYFNVNKSDLIEDKSEKNNTKEIKIPTSPLVHKITEKVVKLSTPRKQNVLNFTEEQLKEQENKVISLEENLFEYKVYEKLSAGTGFSYFNDGNYDTVFFDKDLDHDFASWVFGDSMEPKYLNGEVVLIKETGYDYDGAVYAVDWDGQTYIKKVYREDNGLRLVSINPKYADKFAPYDENPRIIGKIVGNFRPVEN
ncbi:S24 family peptidase [Streptococcus orisratti]|uniref:S24 family peptidase n=1 Tax=Streptococcus orisratti TaxID=114652 RepID=UPI0030B83571